MEDGRGREERAMREGAREKGGMGVKEESWEEVRRQARMERKTLT